MCSVLLGAKQDPQAETCTCPAPALEMSLSGRIRSGLGQSKAGAAGASWGFLGLPGEEGDVKAEHIRNTSREKEIRLNGASTSSAHLGRGRG